MFEVLKENQLLNNSNMPPIKEPKNKKVMSEMEELKNRNIALENRLEIKEKFIEELGNTNNKLNEDLETEMREHGETLTKLNDQIFANNHLKDEIISLNNAFNISKEQYEKQLEICEAKLKVELNRTVTDPHNTSLIFNKDNQIDSLEARLKSIEKELREATINNSELLDKVKELECLVVEKDKDLDNLSSWNKCLKSELQTKIIELESEIHASKVVPNFASKGNSLFGEVVDGREKQEKEFLALFEEKEKYKCSLDKTLKMLHEYALRDNQSFETTSRNRLNGPTLGAFKKTKDELKKCQREKHSLMEQLHCLEELQESEFKKFWELSKNSEDFRQSEYVREENLRAKHRAEIRIRELEMINSDLLETIRSERTRASSIPDLERKINTLNHIISKYETDLLKKNE